MKKKEIDNINPPFITNGVFLSYIDIYNKKTMAKIIRLTESDLVRLVQRIITEQEDDDVEEKKKDKVYNEDFFRGTTCKKVKEKVSQILKHENKKGHKSVLSGLISLMKEMKDEKKLQYLRKLRKKMEDCLDDNRDFGAGAYGSAFAR